MPRLLYYGQPINWASPLNRGLVSRWQVVPWYASGPRWIDLCGKNHGTLTNGPTWDGARGRQGGYGSLLLDGTNDYVTVPSNPTLQFAGSSFAITGWVYLQNDTTKGVFGKYNVTHEYLVYNTSSLAFRITDGTVVSRTKTNNSWNFFAAWVDVSAGTVNLTVNNSAVATASYSTGITNGADALEMGRFSGTTTFCLPGGLDDIRLFRRALSASEVKALYEDSCAGSPRALNWTGDTRRMPQLGGLLTQRQWCAGLDRHWVGGLM